MHSLASIHARHPIVAPSPFSAFDFQVKGGGSKGHIISRLAIDCHVKSPISETKGREGAQKYTFSESSFQDLFIN